jgi:hypothetical protein
MGMNAGSASYQGSVITRGTGDTAAAKRPRIDVRTRELLVRLARAFAEHGLILHGPAAAAFV